ncbi:MAG: hypothetical protein J6F30_03540 [Cellulosilyticum sp.]|nr:hypothetical protein [Cellulosilyticum sp.]
MAGYFEEQVEALYKQVIEVIENFSMLKAQRAGERLEVPLPEETQRAFWNIVDQVSFTLIEDKDNFYGYFLFQMLREMRFDISSPTAIHFKGAKYVIYFNPLIFLKLNRQQMATSIKHEILHVVSMHLKRAEALKEKYSTLAINLAMDIVVNKYLDHLPPYATTLNTVNLHYGLELEPYETFEYYLNKIQIALDLLEDDEEGEEDDRKEDEHDENQMFKDEYDPEKTHAIWEETDDIDEKTLTAFTKKQALTAQKGEMPTYLGNMLAELKNAQGEVPWQLYLDKLMGRLESQKKKTMTRRNRRQPERLDLRGHLRGHSVEIAIAIDISGSMSNEEFKQAMKEVFQIVKRYKHAVTIIECDQEVRRVYKVQSIKDLKERFASQGGTLFSPVFSYVNKERVDLLIYFTDGEGEKCLQTVPRQYKVLWVLSGRSQQLSLEKPYGMIKKLKEIKVIEEQPDMKDVRQDGYSMNNQEPI